MCREVFMARKNQVYCPGQKCSSRAQVLKGFGITPEIFWDLLEKQGHCCAACHQPFKSLRGQIEGPHVDHDHATGRVRGLLHLACNTSLGQAGDDPEVVFRWAAHLSQLDLRDLCLV
jgi:hypothetical protein